MSPDSPPAEGDPGPDDLPDPRTPSTSHYRGSPASETSGRFTGRDPASFAASSAPSSFVPSRSGSPASSMAPPPPLPNAAMGAPESAVGYANRSSRRQSVDSSVNVEPPSPSISARQSGAPISKEQINRPGLPHIDGALEGTPPATNLPDPRRPPPPTTTEAPKLSDLPTIAQPGSSQASSVEAQPPSPPRSAAGGRAEDPGLAVVDVNAPGLPHSAAESVVGVPLDEPTPEALPPPISAPPPLPSTISSLPARLTFPSLTRSGSTTSSMQVQPPSPRPMDALGSGVGTPVGTSPLRPGLPNRGTDSFDPTTLYERQPVSTPPSIDDVPRDVSGLASVGETSLTAGTDEDHEGEPDSDSEVVEDLLVQKPPANRRARGRRSRGTKDPGYKPTQEELTAAAAAEEEDDEPSPKKGSASKKGRRARTASVTESPAPRPGLGHQRRSSRRIAKEDPEPTGAKDEPEEEDGQGGQSQSPKKRTRKPTVEPDAPGSAATPTRAARVTRSSIAGMGAVSEGPAKEEAPVVASPTRRRMHHHGPKPALPPSSSDSPPRPGHARSTSTSAPVTRSQCYIIRIDFPSHLDGPSSSAFDGPETGMHRFLVPQCAVAGQDELVEMYGIRVLDAPEDSEVRSARKVSEHGEVGDGKDRLGPKTLRALKRLLRDPGLLEDGQIELVVMDPDEAEARVLGAEIQVDELEQEAQREEEEKVRQGMEMAMQDRLPSPPKKEVDVKEGGKRKRDGDGEGEDKASPVKKKRGWFGGLW